MNSLKDKQKATPETKYLIRFAEIALKGKNRTHFQNLLVKNIKETLDHFKIQDFTVEKTWSRIFVSVPTQTEKDKKLIETALNHIAGIHSYSQVSQTTSSINAIKSEIVKQLKKMPNKKFNLNVNRANKDFPLTSPEITQQLINQLTPYINQLDYTSLHNINIDLRKNASYIYTTKQKGLGGLPKGSEGKAISLLSGGIDSPVATILAIKRGLHIDCIHMDLTNDQKYLDKIHNLYTELQKYDPTMKLRIIDYTEYRDHLLNTLKPNEKRYSCVLCKRGMLHIAKIIADTINTNAIVTGENLGQVASQTLSNMNTITPPNILTLRPLLTYDKEEITQLMRRYELDGIANIKTRYSCPLLPTNPATRSDKIEIEEIEKNIKSKQILQKIAFDSLTSA